MDQPDREAESLFAQPVRQISVMLIVLALVVFGAYVAFPRVAPVFLANPFLNGFILLVFVIGVVACFWQVLQLISSVSWIEGFASGRPGHNMVAPPRLLAPLASLLRTRGAKMQMSSTSARSPRAGRSIGRSMSSARRACARRSCTAGRAPSAHWAVRRTANHGVSRSRTARKLRWRCSVTHRSRSVRQRAD